MGTKHGKRQKGCPMCKSYKFKDGSQSSRKPFSELRSIGKSRRVSRHDVGDLVAS